MTGFIQRRPDALTIGLASETFPPEINGVAMSVSRFTRGLIRLGHHVQLICPYRSDRRREDLPEGASLLTVRGLPLPRYPGLRFGLPAGRAIRRLWNQQPPDIVYVATQGPLGWSVAREARRCGIPVLSGYHTNFDIYCRHYGLKALETLVLGWLRRFHRSTDCTLAPTDEIRERLEALGVGEVRVLGRGVDTQLFTPRRRDPALRAAWGLGDDALAVIYVGRLAPEKNLQLAVCTYRAVQGMRDDARFVLVGDGPLEAGLRRDNPDFIFCGMQSGEALARHYASGDLFLFPSLTETFGNVLLEALASGLAVAAFDCAAARQHIRSYFSGITADPGNESAFLHAALTLAGDAAMLRTTRDNARLHAITQGWDNASRRFEALLLEHAARRNNGPLVNGCDSVS